MNKERVYVCNLGLSEETYKVIIDYIEEKNLGIIQERTVEEWDLSELYQISASDICILLLTEKAVQDSMLYKKLSIIWEYINKEHVSVLPIASGNQSYIEKLPSGLSSLHILNLKDPLLIEKVCRFFVTQSSFSGIRSDIMQVESCLQTGKISNCSAKQLFNYALGLLYGIEVDKDLKHALIVLCCLVGNDAFEPDFIHFNPDRASRAGLAKELMSFSNELMVYLDHRIDAINETQDYRDFETLIDYAALVQRIGKSLYGWNADESLRKLRDVVSLFFSKDHSVIAGRWLMNYYWERALREADGGYYRKALDCIMEIVIVGEDIEQKHNDPQVQILLFKCYSVLAHYFMCRRSMIEELIERKITDKVIDNGTFKPEYREIRRKPEDRALLNRLVRNSKMLCYQKIDEIMKDGIGLEQYKYLLSEVLNAGYISILFKAHTVKNIISEWYISVSEYIKSKIDDFSRDYQLRLLKTSSDFLSMLQQRYIPKTCDIDLFKIAEFMERIFNLNQEELYKLGIDKSEIYVVYLSYYTENKEYDKYDYYAYKLFELVANRDHDDVDVIKGLLVDIYDTAVERMKMKMWSSTKKYIELGWTICKSYIQLPSQLSEAYDAFKEAASQLGLL